jgi:DNA-binding transcriptional MerR regulator
MLKISAQLNDEEFLGTAEDLAAFVSDKLASLGFGDRHRSTERLVRFYAYEGLLSKPERAPDDRRKANFGPLQVRQLLLARLLAERGWDLDRIRTLLHDNREVSQLNKLIDESATPSRSPNPPRGRFAIFPRSCSRPATTNHLTCRRPSSAVNPATRPSSSSDRSPTTKRAPRKPSV